MNFFRYAAIIALSTLPYNEAFAHRDYHPKTRESLYMSTPERIIADIDLKNQSRREMLHLEDNRRRAILLRLILKQHERNEIGCEEKPIGPLGEAIKVIIKE